MHLQIFLSTLFSLLASTYCTVTSVYCTSDVCPHEIISYNCTVTGSSNIKWGYKYGDNFDGVVLPSTQNVGYSLSDYGLTVTLIGKTSTSLTARVEFNVTNNLNNTYMLCDDKVFGDPDLDDGCYISLKDFGPPNAPTGLSHQVLSDTSVKLNWTAPKETKTGCISEYQVSLDGVTIQNTTDTSSIIDGLNSTLNHSVKVVAIDNTQRMGEPAQLYIFLGNTSSIPKQTSDTTPSVLPVISQTTSFNVSKRSTLMQTTTSSNTFTRMHVQPTTGTATETAAATPARPTSAASSVHISHMIYGWTTAIIALMMSFAIHTM